MAMLLTIIVRLSCQEIGLTYLTYLHLLFSNGNPVYRFVPNLDQFVSPYYFDCQAEELPLPKRAIIMVS